MGIKSNTVRSPLVVSGNLKTYAGIESDRIIKYKCAKSLVLLDYAPAFLQVRAILPLSPP
ncbi:MAG: hypothetical protein KME32_10085 [Mojavia pulchra JT2-VF2]|uniref:Uncharacterized protein n=1 Tax=Mojavia pulchra JT2-VF2 TaxID=287848 RepID=A0A951UGW7_9NOST|nr:hypothetical protein [Mojavia pulchra JT2-VF2]